MIKQQDEISQADEPREEFNAETSEKPHLKTSDA
jgi:hypothetical protein